MTIGIVGYGMGNQRSVLNALEHLGAAVEITESPDRIAGLDKVILPGVGAFAEAMKRLNESGYRAALDAHVAAGKPLLGICLGMQVLGSLGLEFGETEGLGYIPGRVEKIAFDGPPMRLPHVGWNGLSVTGDCPILQGLGEAPDVYFVHSFHMVADDPAAVAATTDYGGAVTAAVWAGSVYGCQFHPEKSQAVGLRILQNFVDL